MENTKIQTRKLAFVLILLAVSLLSVQPALILAAHGPQQGTISINATGQATPIDKKSTGGAAKLSLSGNVHQGGEDQLKLRGLTGILHAGSNNYSILDGQGEVNKHGEIEINAKANGNGNHKYELTLHGMMQGNSVTFDSHESKLSSLFFLSLKGQANITINSSSKSGKEGENGTTITQTVTHTINNGTNTIFQNQTVTITQGNHTITFTVTTTVGNSTITKTMTTTVANTTITISRTVTVANTTITVTNTTTTKT